MRMRRNSQQPAARRHPLRKRGLLTDANHLHAWQTHTSKVTHQRYILAKMFNFSTTVGDAVVKSGSLTRTSGRRWKCCAIQRILDISPSANGAVLGNNVHQVSCALSTDNSVVWGSLLLIKHCDNEALRLETTVRESERERERETERQRDRDRERKTDRERDLPCQGRLFVDTDK
jgi:hypothetical protein